MEIKKDKRTPLTLRKQYSIDAPNIVSLHVSVFFDLYMATLVAFFQDASRPRASLDTDKNLAELCHSG